MWSYTLFPAVVNMSITASVTVCAVLLARLALRRAPRIFSYVLWAVVLFRLLCPVSLSSPLSALNLASAPVSAGAVCSVPLSAGASAASGETASGPGKASPFAADVSSFSRSSRLKNCFSVRMTLFSNQWGLVFSPT